MNPLRLLTWTFQRDYGSSCVRDCTSWSSVPTTPSGLSLSALDLTRNGAESGSHCNNSHCNSWVEISWWTFLNLISRSTCNFFWLDSPEAQRSASTAFECALWPPDRGRARYLTTNGLLRPCRPCITTQQNAARHNRPRVQIQIVSFHYLDFVSNCTEVATKTFVELASIGSRAASLWQDWGQAWWSEYQRVSECQESPSSV